jgi:hypothetical protein
MALRLRLSVVSVYERKLKISTRNIRRKRCSPGFRGQHQPVLLLLHIRYHSVRDPVWSVSKWEIWRYQQETQGENDIHLVFSESISQWFRSFIADIIRSKIQCGKCLWQKIEYINKKHKEKKIFTLVSRKATANAFAPSSPISFNPRFSVVSVYERKLKISTKYTRRKRYPPCFLGKHPPVISLLHRRYRSLADWVRSVSMKENWRYQQNTQGEKDIHCVFSESSSQCFCSFISDTIRSQIEWRECLWEKI